MGMLSFSYVFYFGGGHLKCNLEMLLFWVTSVSWGQLPEIGRSLIFILKITLCYFIRV